MGLEVRDEGRAQAALLARRCTLRSDPDLIEQLAGLSRDEAISAVLNVEPDTSTAPRSDKSDKIMEWWFTRIRDTPKSLQDRMTFFWHSIIPTHRYSVGQQELIAYQLDMIRANALGNFRELLHGFISDGAMLLYLDADNSSGKRPNENLARELMELFTIGVGQYKEQDVRAAALAMSGWRVDKDNQKVTLDTERMYGQPVTFLGDTATWDAHTIVDRLCDHPATAARIGSMVWYHFTGKALGSDARTELGSWWQGQNLDVGPLLDRIVRSEAFWADHYARPRTGFEYYTAAQKILQFEPEKVWRARSLGQMPYEPPNVGGWPIGDRWLSPDSVLRRGEQMFSISLERIRDDLKTTTVDDVLTACGMWVISDETRSALTNLDSYLDDLGPDAVGQLRWRVALSSPEFQLQ